MANGSGQGTPETYGKCGTLSYSQGKTEFVAAPKTNPFFHRVVHSRLHRPGFVAFLAVEPADLTSGGCIFRQRVTSGCIPGLYFPSTSPAFKSGGIIG